MVDFGNAQSRIHQSVTNRIVEAIEAGAGEFVMPWHGTSARNGMPINVASRRSYAGGNVVGLWADAALRGLQSRFWGTYRQWQALGSQVRKGEKGSAIVFYKPVDDDAPDSDAQRAKPRFIARGSIVFNAEQVDGWADPEPLPRKGEAQILDHVERFVVGTGALIKRGFLHACYDRRADWIEMPALKQFVATPTSSATEAHYATLLHELVHWTGAEHRLNRVFGKRFGDEAYAAEELIAELGAAFLCADLGISNEPRGDHAAYAASWLKILKHDGRAIFTASNFASQAARHLQEQVCTTS